MELRLFDYTLVMPTRSDATVSSTILLTKCDFMMGFTTAIEAGPRDTWTMDRKGVCWDILDLGPHVFYPKHCFSSFGKHTPSTHFVRDICQRLQQSADIDPQMLPNGFQCRVTTLVWQIRLMRITGTKVEVPVRRIIEVVVIAIL